MRRIGGYVDGCLRRNIASKWMHTGILSGGEFSAKEKLCDVVVDGREFKSSVKMPFLRLQFLLSTKKTLSILLYTSQVKLLFLLLRETLYSKHVYVTVKFVLK